MRLVIMSDTHKQHHHPMAQPPDGDVLIHCGDFTMHGGADDLEEFNRWLLSQPHKHKLAVFGNHDQTCDPCRDNFFVEGNREIITAAIILEDSGCEIDGVRFWGMPYHPMYNGWPQSTFMRTGEQLKEHCSLIPNETDVLITHGPPFGICDIGAGNISAGCHHLLDAVRRVKPKVNCFGHIHTGGQHEENGTLFINAALHDERCSIVRSPVVLDI